MTAADYILNFKYTGNKVKLDMEFVLLKAIDELDSVLNSLQAERLNMIREGYKKKEVDSIIAAIIEDISGKKIVDQFGKSVPFQKMQKLVTTFENRQNRLVRELTNVLVAQPMNEFQKENPELKYHWRLGSVQSSHCPDCSKLASISSDEGAKTIAEWRQYGYGLPREGHTACNVGCKCMLEVEDDKN